MLVVWHCSGCGKQMSMKTDDHDGAHDNALLYRTTCDECQEKGDRKENSLEVKVKCRECGKVQTITVLSFGAVDWALNEQRDAICPDCVKAKGIEGKRNTLELIRQMFDERVRHVELMRFGDLWVCVAHAGGMRANVEGRANNMEGAITNCYERYLND